MGSYALWFAAICCVIAFTFSLRRQSSRVAAWAFGAGCGAVWVAFGSLAALFIKDQFQFSYVFAHSDRASGLAYKVAGVWSGQEGSFLLWACTSALFGLLTLRSVGPYRRVYVAAYALFLGSLAGILVYESPFVIPKEAYIAGRAFIPFDGAGLVPALRNYWVIIHPPTIFLGFGSLTVLACWALSAMVRKDAVTWVPLVRPWALLSVAILGLGICMGGFWAYETLGWGGFWAWDPVENASFVPWLLAVGFTHGLIVQASRKRWISTNLLMAGLPFLAFLYGTFLTRSGFLTEVSVHSFAEMNRSALKILIGILSVSAIGYLGLWFGRGLPMGKVAAEGYPLGAHRESAYQAAVVLLSMLSLAIALGMSVPLFMAAAGKPAKVVEEGLYHLVVAWFFVPIMVLVAIGPFLSWRSAGWKHLAGRFGNVVGISVGISGCAYFLMRRAGWDVPLSNPPEQNFGLVAFPLGMKIVATPWLMFLLFLCVVAVVSNLWRCVETLRTAKALSIGGFVAHVGLAVFMAGMVLSRGFEQKQQVLVQPGRDATALGYRIRFADFVGRPGVADVLRDPGTRVKFELLDTNGEKLIAKPSLYYSIQGGEEKPVVWPHIERSAAGDVYVALAPPVYTVWEEPVSIKEGETKVVNGITAKYLRMERKGEAGKQGTKFSAHLELQTPNGSFHATPGISVGSQPELFPAGPYFVSMLGMDAATNSATIQIYYREPFFPLEIFIKPMTGLVWIGAGILTLGGLIAAIYRRVPRRVNVGEPATPLSQGNEPHEALATP